MQSQHSFTMLTHGIKNWKWQMRTWPLLYADLVKDHLREHDLLFVSDYVDLATLVGLVPAIAQMPKVLYMHENQLAYPNQQEDGRDIHFGLTHISSMQVADQVWFNSQWNRDSFIDELKKLMSRFPKTLGLLDLNLLTAKFMVMPLGLNLPELETRHRNHVAPLKILWNHRWEYDKNPADFLHLLKSLKELGFEFELILLGEGAGKHPVCQQILKTFPQQVLFCGFAANKQAYWAWLQRADIVVSTAVHEFFGIAVCEAVHAGCWPMVPNKLAYPEWLGKNMVKHFTYHNQKEFMQSILQWNTQKNKEQLLSQLKDKVSGFSWRLQAQLYDQGFVALMSNG